MKRIVFSPAALTRFDDILAYTIERFGLLQAETYTALLIERLDALAAGAGPAARPCEILMRGVREASGLKYYREGSHYLILREKPGTLEVVEILHGKMDLETHLQPLAEATPKES